MLEFAGLRLQRGGRLLLDVPHLAVHRGEVLAVVGPNGAGKSSLLLSLALLVPANFDRYAFDGRVALLPGDALALRRQMAMVFQEPLLLHTTALANAAEGLRLRGVDRTMAVARATTWLDRLGVGHLAHRSSRELSGGEAQRVSLARALALTPRLLLLDEPFAALDVLTRGDLLRDLRLLLRESGTTALLVTHDVGEVARLADRVAVLEAGRLVQLDTPGAVLAAPATPMVQRMAESAREMAEALGPLAAPLSPKGCGPA